MKTLNKRISWNSLMHIVVFFFYFITYLFLLINYPMSSDQARIRYPILLICILFEFFVLIKSKGLMFFKKTKYNSMLLILLVGIIFFLYSVYLASSHGEMLSSRTLPQIFLFVSPAIYVYCLLNNIDKTIVMRIMKMALLISIFGYFLESGHTLFDFFDFSNYSTLFTVHSFVESALFSEIFLQLFLFFNYFSIIYDAKKSNLKPFLIASVIFVLLCNKRLAVAIVLLTPLVNITIKKFRNKIRGVVPSISLSIIFVILAYIYFGMLEHRLFTDIDIYNLSTGRDYILSLWQQHDYLSLGYGSSLLISGRYLELDLVEILLELGPISLFIFCFAFLNSARKSSYSLLIAFYCLFNMLTASGLPYSAGLILMFISIKTIEDCENDK